MSDDKSKRGPTDRSKISGQERYEVYYAAKQLAPEFPGKPLSQIEKAVVDSTKVKNFHNSRPMVMNSARLKLKNS